MSRYFFALDINEQDKTNIARWRTTAITTNLSNSLNSIPKTIPSENFHITLLFLGALSEQKKRNLMSQTTDIATKVSNKITSNDNSHCLHINELGLFKKPKVLYLTNKSIPNWLTELNKYLSEIAKRLTIPIENRPYLPHISLFRKAKFLIPTKQADININIKSFSLYESSSLATGVKYIPLRTWQL